MADDEEDVSYMYDEVDQFEEDNGMLSAITARSELSK
jgi:hypothetical protein